MITNKFFSKPKNLRVILSAMILVTTFTLFNSCDDAGILRPNVTSGTIVFTATNFMALNQSVDGFYALWLRLDSASLTQYYRLGAFNVANGVIVNLDGAPMQFKYLGDTNRLYLATRVLVSIEKDTFTLNPNSKILISSPLTITQDTLTATLTLAGSEALDTAGARLLTGGNSGYILNTPTDGGVLCTQGVWFCDSLGNSLILPGIIMKNTAWIYEGWIVDRTNPNSPVYYTTGRFMNPDSTDSDGAGPCSGTIGTGYQKPGEDWIQTGGTCPTFTNLSNGNFAVLISLEPADEVQGSPAYSTPFMQLFYQPQIVSSLGCRRVDPYLINQYAQIPRAFFKIYY